MVHYYPTPFSGWRLAVEEVAGAVQQIDWLPASQYPSISTPLPAWLVRYFEGDPTLIDQLSLNLLERLAGTPFQLRVWQQLQQIPFGQTESYGALAERLASSPRAVANACRANPLALVVPCHRVVSQRGWGGYMGATTGVTLELKQQLIQREQIYAIIDHP